MVAPSKPVDVDAPATGSSRRRALSDALTRLELSLESLRRVDADWLEVVVRRLGRTTGVRAICPLRDEVLASPDRAAEDVRDLTRGALNDAPGTA